MPNLRGVVRLPQKRRHLKEVPVEQFLESQLGQVRPIEVRPFSWWGYCLITLGIVTSVIMGILIYHKWGDTIAGCLPDARMKSVIEGHEPAFDTQATLVKRWRNYQVQKSASLTLDIDS